jgi:hypothetical protein
MATKFTVSEKAVRDRDGDAFALENYVEGIDYVQRKCFSSLKRVYRSDILGVSVVDPSLVEHKQEPLPPEHPVFIPPFERATLELDEKGLRITWPETKEESPVRGTSGDQVQECKIKKIYANFKWVETDKGRVWVGLKGFAMRVNQIIRVKNGELFLGKTAAGPSLVRI